MNVNQDDFKVQPTNKFVAVFENQARLEDALPKLEPLKVGTADIEVLKGEGGADIIDAHGQTSGLLGGVVRVIQQISDDHKFFEQYEEDLREGRVVAFIPGSDKDKEAVSKVLRAHGAISIRYMGQFVTEDL